MGHRPRNIMMLGRIKVQLARKISPVATHVWIRLASMTIIATRCNDSIPNIDPLIYQPTLLTRLNGILCCPFQPILAKTVVEFHYTIVGGREMNNITRGVLIQYYRRSSRLRIGRSSYQRLARSTSTASRGRRAE